jgi:thioredoxin-dependent peroxiredoxin
MAISAGIPAPDFTLPDANGDLHTLSNYRGSPVVLYFYPKDDTPGCITEACSFRDNYSQYGEYNAVILGVSPDPPKKHLKFKAKYGLPFILLSDVDHKVCELYGVWGRKKFMGREYDGVFRTTFLINPQGQIQHVFENVKPDGHSQEVIEALAAI